MQSAADLTKQEQQRRQRQLARLIQPEFNPQRVLVLGDQGLAAALQALQVEAWGLAEGKGPALPDSWPQSYDLVVVQGSDVPAPPALPGNRVLFLAAEPEEPSALPAWAPALAQGGLQRDFSWKSWGLLSGAALYRPGSEDAAGLAQGYEEAMEALRLRLDRAEQSCRDYQKLTEHQRSELSAAHQHEQQLESALSSVTGSHCWKLTWPVRYLISKGRALWHSFPLFVLLAQLRQEGLAGLRQRRQDRRYYEENFPGQTFRAARLAPVELLVRQSKTQPQGPLISIVVPLYNTPPALPDRAAGFGGQPDLPQLGAVPGGCRPGRKGGAGCGRPHGPGQPHPLPEAGQKRRHRGQHQRRLCFGQGRVHRPAGPRRYPASLRFVVCSPGHRPGGGRFRLHRRGDLRGQGGEYHPLSSQARLHAG